LLRVELPRTEEPSLNVTVPVALEGVTEANKVTGWPGVADVGDADRRVVESAFLTTSVTAVEVLAALLASPPYTAVKLWVPTESVVVVNEAVPLLTVAVPIAEPPSRKVTVPVALAGEKDATNVTLCPYVAEFGLADRLVVVFA